MHAWRGIALHELGFHGQHGPGTEDRNAHIIIATDSFSSKALWLLGASALGLGLAALAPASCGAPQAEAGPSRVQGAAGSGPTAAPPSHSWDLKAGRIAVSGRLAPDVIRAVMRDQFGRFRECYETLPPRARWSCRS